MTPFAYKMTRKRVFFSSCGDVIVLLPETHNSLCPVVKFPFSQMAMRSLLKINRMPTSLAHFHLPELCLSVCSSGNLNSFPPLSWPSCDCHGHLPVTVPQEVAVLGRNAQWLAICTLELGGHVILRVCIILNKKQVLYSCGAIPCEGKKINLYLRSNFPEFPDRLNWRFFVLFFFFNFWKKILELLSILSAGNNSH